MNKTSRWLCWPRARCSPAAWRGRGQRAAASRGRPSGTCGCASPDHTPPGPAVGAAWTVLEGFLGYTGYRLLQDPPSPARTTGLAGWGLTLLGLAGYPWLFFGERRLTASTVAAAGMLTATTVTAVAARSTDKAAFRATLPLLAWLGFATVLSAQLQHANRRLSAD